VIAAYDPAKAHQAGNSPSAQTHF